MDFDSSFLVLIGSQARGDADERSDVDLLVVGNPPESEVAILARGFIAPCNRIVFSQEEFAEIYRTGSLFLLHCFEEGRLCKGSRTAWEGLRAEFKVRKDFSEELSKCLSVCRLLIKTEIFGGHYLMPLVAAYTQAKNASIFGLAQIGTYVFNKDRAIEVASRRFMCSDANGVLSLRSAYDYSVRCLDVPLPFAMDSIPDGDSALFQVERFVRAISDACK